MFSLPEISDTYLLIRGSRFFENVLNFGLSRLRTRAKFFTEVFPNHTFDSMRTLLFSISEYCMGYGMGAKTCSTQIQASDIFSLSGDMFEPTIKYNQLLDKYEEVNNKVELSFPVKCSCILEYVTKYAKYESEHHKGRNYYCLIYITPGVISDIDCTVELLQEIYSFPLTVTIVKISNPDFSESNDIETLYNQFLEVHKSDQRQPLFILDYDKFKKENDLNRFELQLISNLPSNAGEYYDSRRSLDLSSKKSISNHKTFADIIGHSLTLDDSEVDDDKEEDKQPCTEENLLSKRQRIGSENTNNSAKKKRKLSFSLISEEVFLATFPVIGDIKQSELEQLVDKGLIFDEDYNYCIKLLNEN